MSTIRNIIAAAVANGQLRILQARPLSAPRIRSLYLAEELFDAIYETRVNRADTARFVALEATLAEFVTSRTLDPEYLCLLTPTSECVWEIRSVRPKPSMRVFGLFAERDSFIATNFEYREVLSDDEIQWDLQMRTAKHVWTRIFPALTPRDETDATQLVTGAVHGKYFKK